MTAQFSLSPRPAAIVLIATLLLLLLQSLLLADFTPPVTQALPAALWHEVQPELRGVIAPVAMVSSDDWLAQAWQAGGGQPETLPRLQATVQVWKQSVRRDLDQQRSTAERATALLTWMHRHVLRTYDENATDLTLLLNRGEYNCVSGTLMYLILARELQLSAATLCRGQHCRVAIHDRGQWLPLETTCAACAGLTALQPAVNPAAVAGNPGSERLLDERGLVGLFWFNRAVDQHKTAQYRAAVAGNLMALRWDPQNTDARTNLLAGMNQVGLQAARQGDVPGATRWLDLAAQVGPLDETTRHNRRYVEGLRN